MAHVAEIIDGRVSRVIVVDNAIEDPEGWCVERFGGQWVQTSYTGKIRGKFAGIGDLYDPESDEFRAPLVIIEPVDIGGGTL